MLPVIWKPGALWLATYTGMFPGSNHNIDADEDDKLISFGFYVCLVFGFIVGFWGVCGTLISNVHGDRPTSSSSLT